MIGSYQVALFPILNFPIFFTNLQCKLFKQKVLKVYREITPVQSGDVFAIEYYSDPQFEYPLHNHPEYELCLTLNSTGNRIVGDAVSPYTELDLVLMGPYVQHRWDDLGNLETRQKASITVIYFDKDLFDSDLINKEAFFAIKKMLLRSVRGIKFSSKVIQEMIHRIQMLKHLQGFDRVLEFLAVLNHLALSKGQKLLSSPSFTPKTEHENSSRINEIYDYIMGRYTEKLPVTEVAEYANMSESAFSHFFKKCTNKSFTRFVVELRIGLACKLLMETQNTINEICFKCGFNNISNFNRLFKKYRETTPMQYRYAFENALDSNSNPRYHLM
jgi:AraC-like DNA-binding protein